jgi:Holliday junction resolvase
VKQLTNYFNSDNFLKGRLGRDVVKSLLERSGYTVCAYGYEETLLDAMSKLTFKKSRSKIGRRIRSSPDLLVYDDKDVMMLVEVKTRSKSKWMETDGIWLRKGEIEALKEFWNEAVLVVVVPEGFYAQRINVLEIQQDDHYRLSDFEKFQDIFTKVQSEDISHYEEIALQIFGIFITKKEKALKNTPPPYELEIEPNINNVK